MNRILRFLGITLLVVAVVFFVPFLCHTPLLKGFKDLRPPRADSFPIGKTFSNDDIRGTGMRNFHIYRSWDTMSVIAGFDNEAALKSAVKKSITLDITATHKDIKVQSVDSLVIYAADDYSTLPLQNGGQYVVSAAVVVKKYTLSSDQGSSLRAAVQTIQEKDPSAKVSLGKTTVTVMSGTGLVSAVKVIEITKAAESVQQLSWRHNNGAMIDPAFHTSDLLVVSALDSMDVCDERILPTALWPQKIACLKLRWQVSGLAFKEGQYIFSPNKGQVAPTSSYRKNPNFQNHRQIASNGLDLATLIMGGESHDTIYQYRIKMDSISVVHGTYHPLGSQQRSIFDFWGLYDIDDSQGTLTVYVNAWKYKEE